MKFLALLPLAAISCTSGITSHQLFLSEEEVLAADARYQAALISQDDDSLSDLLTEDWVFIHSDGVVETKQHFLAAIRNGRSWPTFVREQVVVRIYGNTGILTARTVRTVISASGDVRSGVNRSTFVYINTPSGVKLASVHASPEVARK